MTLLDKFIESKNIPHALIVAGARRSTLVAMATKFAKDLVGSYPNPDVHEYFPEGKINMHSIQQIRQLIKDVALFPYKAERQVFIIHDAEKMLPTSSNALLKTLEEPEKYNVLILLSTAPRRIIPTLQSRCQIVQCESFFSETSNEIIEVLLKKRDLEDISDEADLSDILTTIMLWCRDRFLLDIEGGEKFLSYPEHVDEIKKYPKIPLDKLEKELSRVKLGSERSIKLSTCLRSLDLFG